MLAPLRTLLEPELLKLVMFDLDGTLVDSVMDLHAALSDMYAELGMRSADLAEVRSWVGNGAQMLVRRALSYDLEPGDLGSDQFELAYKLFLQAYSERNGQAAQLYDGAVELIAALKNNGVQVAIVTNKPKQFTEPLLAQLKLEVALVLSGDSLEHKKPHPQPLEHCLAHFQCMPSQAVMIGDSSSDLLAAQAAGVKSIAVSYGYNHGVSISDYQPDLLVDSLTELR